MKKVIRNICLIGLCLLLVGCGKKDKTKVESIENYVTKEQVIDGLKIHDISFNSIDGITTYTATVTNTTDKDIGVEDINIVIKNKEEKELLKLIGYVGSVIKPGESKGIISNADNEVSNAYSIAYEVNKK